MTAMQLGGQRDEVEVLSLMLLIRRFEERASQQYQAQKIEDLSSYIGQEAVVTGAVAAVRDDDYVITACAIMLMRTARGASAWTRAWRSFSEGTGCSRGLGGSMHFRPENHICGSHAIVRARSTGGGMAFAIKYPGKIASRCASLAMARS
jgi:pyruvate dehydrogenase E1 component alpha subunit